jgi:hypothetical protein
MRSKNFITGIRPAWLVSPDAVADILTLPAGLRAAVAFFCFVDGFAFIKIMTCKITLYSYYTIDL